MKKLTLFILLAVFLQASSFSQSCLPNGIIFSTQGQIDSFQINYPGCTEIEGNVQIGDLPLNPFLIDTIADIANLNGLSVLTSIWGDLEIGYLWQHGYYPCLNKNPLLINLVGLDNLVSVGGDLFISFNDTLENLAGLGALTSIGGSLYIGYWNSGGNPNLTSLAGLESLNYIGGGIGLFSNYALTTISALSNLSSIGGLIIWNNHALASLTGLENLNPGSIQNLHISKNYLLSTCDIISVCDYLANPNGSVTISQNAPGCNNQQEVDSLCNITGVPDFYNEHEISISPNPVIKQALLSLNIHLKSSVEVYIYNTKGICLKSWQYPNQETGEKEFDLDLKDLQQGIYFCRVRIGNETVTRKIIKL